jgi:hypothetical protein
LHYNIHPCIEIQNLTLCKWGGGASSCSSESEVSTFKPLCICLKFIPGMYTKRRWQNDFVRKRVPQTITQMLQNALVENLDRFLYYLFSRVCNSSSLKKVRAQICNIRAQNQFQGIDSKESIPPIYLAWRAATITLHRLAESIPWNRFLGSLNIYKFGLSIACLRPCSYDFWLITICCVAGWGVLVPQRREPGLSGFPGQESYSRQLLRSSSARWLFRDLLIMPWTVLS